MNLVDNLFVVEICFSFFVEFVNLFLKLNFRRLSLFCLVFRMFASKASNSILIKSHFRLKSSTSM